EIGENNGIHFIAMEYIRGETLAARMKRQPLTSQEIIDLSLQATDALQEAHAKGIIHRDIKPANMILSTRGQLKLVDFGLAKIHSNEASLGSIVSTASQTELGTIIGTLPYMSPEQVLGKNVDRRTDFFSLGIVLYELAMRKLPFQGDTAVELADAIIHKEPITSTHLTPQLPALSKIIFKLLQKDPNARYQNAGEIISDLEKLRASTTPRASFFGMIRTPAIVIPSLLVLIALISGGYWMFQRYSKEKWAKGEALLQITELVDEGKYPEAVALGLEAEKYIPNHPLLNTLWGSMAITSSIQTDPAGAEVFLQPYQSPNENWKKIGNTPLTKLRIPREYYRMKITKSGYRTTYATLPRAFFQKKVNFSYSLKDLSKLPPGMVRVPGLNTDPDARTGSGAAETFPVQDDFLMDEFEVNNKEFKKFLDSGGYRDKKYWKVPFIKDGHEISFDQAMRLFHDATGRPGPLQWEVGSYPRGEDDYPVTGISWYEASAYAEFVGKNLPTIHHWYHAAGAPMSDQIILVSNFSRSVPLVVQDRQSLSPYGTYNMAGNVKEWSSTETTRGQQFILGGAYTEPTYLFMEADQRSPFDREKIFGFRCVRYLSNVPTDLTAAFIEESRDYSKEKPVGDDVFQVLKTFYSYPKKDLNAKLESSEVEGYVKKEKVSFTTAYDNERMDAYLFLPVNATPPYQAVIFFPGASAQRTNSSENLEQTGYGDYLDFIVRSGRVAIYPIYMGTFERGGGATEIQGQDALREWRMKIIKDVSRAVDYVETRADINKDKLAFYGSSWGGRVGSFVGAVEPRFETMILLHGGFPSTKRPPETDEINFAPRVHIPVLMINGRYDHVFPIETSQLPMFNMLGTPKEQKVHLLFEGGHNAPRKEVVKIVLDWLDRYLGPVS
ncbi:MAG TPA: SUMF1/EgtB/PvdO family nonheme iron enzyme, partial [Acidobacteriota bacterium]|nr:SUMF1/EgtB/PvdO family nonheme iron enzyme [Acidobacteriota bacterium]